MGFFNPSKKPTARKQATTWWPLKYNLLLLRSRFRSLFLDGVFVHSMYSKRKKLTKTGRQVRSWSLLLMDCGQIRGCKLLTAAVYVCEPKLASMYNWNSWLCDVISCHCGISCQNMARYLALQRQECILSGLTDWLSLQGKHTLNNPFS